MWDVFPDDMCLESSVELALANLDLNAPVDPDLCRNATEQTHNHKYRDAAEITLHFINIKELKFAYRQWN